MNLLTMKRKCDIMLEVVDPSKIEGGEGSPLLTGQTAKEDSSYEVPQDLLTEIMQDFVCDGKVCGAKCCTNILLLSDKEIAKIRNYVNRNNIPVRNRHNIFSQEYIDICPFLNEDYKCDIWLIRPKICESFFCNTFLKKKPNIPDYKKLKPVNMLLTFSPNSYCPNAPDLKEVYKKFKELKKKVYK